MKLKGIAWLGEMPEGWKKIQLNNVCIKESSNVSMKSIEQDSGNYPIYGAQGFIKNVSFYHQKEMYISIIKDGAGIGRIDIRKSYSSIIGTLEYIKPKKEIDIYYLYYFLCSIKLSNYTRQTTIPHLYFKDYSREIIPLPPLQMQKRIADFLDEKTAHIDALITKKQRHIELLDEKRQAVITRAVSKGLDPHAKMKATGIAWLGEIPEGWKKIQLNNVCIKESSNVSMKSIEQDSGNYPIYGAQGFIKNVSFYHQKEMYISIIKDGAGIGRIDIRKSYSSIIGTLEYIKPKKEIDIYYLYYFLCSIKLSNYTRQTTIPHLYFKDYSREIIPLPPLQEQKRIADFLDRQTRTIDAAQDTIKTSIALLKEYRASLLEHAVLGRLKHLQ